MPDYRQVVFNQLLADLKEFLDAAGKEIILDTRLSRLYNKLKYSALFASTQLEDSKYERYEPRDGIRSHSAD